VTPIELFIITAARAVVEVAGCAMLGQALVYVLAGRRRTDNFVYQLFSIVTRPVFALTRKITPQLVRDDHVPFAAFLLVVWLWVGLGMAKRYICVTQGVPCGDM